MTKRQQEELFQTRKELDVMAKLVEILIPLTERQRASVLNEASRRLTWENEARSRDA